LKFWLLVFYHPRLPSPHPLSAPEGLTEMPHQWWIEIQRLIFFEWFSADLAG